MTTQKIENPGSPLLPAHGPITCRKCWPADYDGNVFTTSDQRFRVVNDPGAWGSQEPAILVLGISKGFTQAREFAHGEFDSVPFKNCRPRLRDVLVLMGLMDPAADINSCMTSAEKDFAWGSVVRCSLSGRKSPESEFSAGTPDVLPAFKHPEASSFLRGCMRTYLKDLPERTRIIVLLGNDDRYVETIGSELQKIYRSEYCRLNRVAHRTGTRVWVHVAHPSPGNGHLSDFIEGAVQTTQGLKRKLAQDTLQSLQLSVPAAPPPIRSTRSSQATPVTSVAEARLSAETLVPVAADGTWFGPHLRRSTGFTVGPKGDERRFEEFSEALEFLRQQPTARWRRPNSQGNWGIVSGVIWKRLSELESATRLGTGASGTLL